LSYFYFTIEKPSEILFVEKQSKFLAFAFPIESEEEIKNNLQQLKQLYPKATHHCYAWRLGNDKQNYRANDDGEPSGTVGKPILGQIDSNNLSNVLVVVIRYYGGTKLGVSGLISAYKNAASMVFQSSLIIEKEITTHLTLYCQYTELNDVLNHLKKNEINQWNDNYTNNCQISFKIGNSKLHNLVSWIENHNFTFIINK